ncbi:pantoate--beta-alanine ligase [Terrimonas pollutisoli]|uniref:pantoate--beta-alanine ligase n=1 Tax=Terrimonas pollutisoli TaxID=3034147 RepID=UPI0023ED8845|nr:pantoate--beta-alanine ligase [Terrimonas sp. H1YJ31]
MVLFKKVKDLQNYLDLQRRNGKKIGFAPTMGALHKGHLSLINGSKKENDITACSIFVNPTQFNDPADFEKYPVTLEQDIMLLESAGTDVLLLPSITEMYPDGATGTKHYDLGYLEEILEGEYRPGHFQGVCMIVHRLLEIVRPDNLYIGQKDYQQCMVIKKLIELTGFNNLTKLNISPTLREPDGLAMSSRNMRLTKDERTKATGIIQALTFVKENLQKGDLTTLKKQASNNLSAKGFKVDYVEIANADTLQIKDNWDGKEKLVALAAAFMNSVRLIDNVILN